MNILKTKDYNQFKKIIGNRQLIPSHIKNLQESFSKQNLSQYIPAIVNEKNELIDGQHRLERAKAMNDWFYYIVVKETDIKTIQLLNTSKNWSLYNYINSYAERGNENYQKLIRLIKWSNLPIWIIIKKIVKTYTSYSVLTKQAKEGKLIIDDKKIDHFKKLVSLLFQIRRYVEGTTLWKAEKLVNAFDYLIKKHPEKIEAIISAIQDYPEKIPPKTTRLDYLYEIERRYNYSRRGKIVRLTE